VILGLGVGLRSHNSGLGFVLTFGGLGFGLECCGLGVAGKVLALE